MIFITNFPSFYKINLYNQIAKKRKIKVIFLGKYSKYRNKNFIDLNFNFDFYFLTKKNYELRKKIKSIFLLFYFLYKNKDKNVVLSGWNEIEYWLCLIFFNRKKFLILESNIHDSKKNFLKLVLKKFFLKFVNTVIASGNLQKKLLSILNFKKKIFISKGVGIINFNKKLINKKICYKKNFLFIGRLESEKNIYPMLNFFIKNKNFNLTMIGQGSQELKVKKIIKGKRNIILIKNVNNYNLKKYFLDTSFLILPSLIEPWGLVIEESLAFNVPVIVSKHCGVCSIIKNNIHGYIYNPNISEGLENIIKNINQKNFKKLKQNISKYPLQNNSSQINTFINL